MIAFFGSGCAHLRNRTRTCDQATSWGRARDQALLSRCHRLWRRRRPPPFLNFTCPKGARGARQRRRGKGGPPCCLVVWAATSLVSWRYPLKCSSSKNPKSDRRIDVDKLELVNRLDCPGKWGWGRMGGREGRTEGKVATTGYSPEEGAAAAASWEWNAQGNGQQPQPSIHPAAAAHRCDGHERRPPAQHT